MGSLKKGLTQTRDVDVRNLHGRISKAALMDVLIDQARIAHGDEDLDGRALYLALKEMLNPILAARGDREVA